MPLAGILLFAMLSAWAISLHFMTRVMQDKLDARLATATATLSEGAFPLSSDLIGRLGRLLDADVVLLSAAGTVGASTGSAELNEALSGAAIAFPGDDSARLIFLDTAAGRWRAAVRKLPAGRDDRFQFVSAAASMEPTSSAVREAALSLAGAMLIAALLSAGLASIFVRSITRPVEDLAQMANRISDGQRDVSAAINERNEIGVLASAFNDMAGRLAVFEQDLSETSRMSGLGDLAARMAHEIRNPMTAIKMQLQMLEERIAGPDQKRIRTVLDEFRRLELIVDSSLTLGGAATVNPAPTRIAATINEVAELLRPSLAHRNIELETHIETLPVVAIDADRIKQVLLNLVNNAADELSAGGCISISASAGDDAHLHISIADSGPGLQGTESVSSKPLGLGLGLKISREIVERHGGELRHNSSHELGGAEFTIRLPLTNETNR